MRSVLIKNQQLLIALDPGHGIVPCRSWWESHFNPPNCNCFYIYPTQRVLHGSQMAANVILLYKRGDFCIAAKAIVKMSSIKTKQKIRPSVFQTSENSTTNPSVRFWQLKGKIVHSLSILLSELAEQWSSQKRNCIIEKLMNFQTSSLWNSELLIRGQAEWAWHRHQSLANKAGGDLESNSCLHPQAKEGSAYVCLWMQPRCLLVIRCTGSKFSFE